jgi:precorrin-3B C17-methyltransferase
MEPNHHGSSRKGILSVVGTGPGSLDYLIPAARKTIERADIIIGYKTYLGLIEEITGGKEIVSSAMMQEVDRVKQGLRLAEEGNNVVLVSGGDPGIYAMAGLVFEVAKELDSAVEIKVVAGIAALNSCAERLGAPLMHDFATISLSDLLTPWELIERRIKAAAEADFVLVVYNPKSRKRDWQLQKLLEIVNLYRHKSTPVGMVKGATRENEEVLVSTLEFFNADLVDMQTTVIVGNSNSFLWNSKMITPRGYHNKYQLD